MLVLGLGPGPGPEVDVVVALLLCQARHTATEHGPELSMKLSIKLGTQLLSSFRFCPEFLFYFIRRM